MHALANKDCFSENIKPIKCFSMLNVIMMKYVDISIVYFFLSFQELVCFFFNSVQIAGTKLHGPLEQVETFFWFIDDNMGIASNYSIIFSINIDKNLKPSQIHRRFARLHWIILKVNLFRSNACTIFISYIHLTTLKRWKWLRILFMT